VDYPISVPVKESHPPLVADRSQWIGRVGYATASCGFAQGLAVC